MARRRRFQKTHKPEVKNTKITTGVKFDEKSQRYLASDLKMAGIIFVIVLGLLISATWFARSSPIIDNIAARLYQFLNL